MELCEVQCPVCFEYFSFPMALGSECEGVELDYDCEVCCNPMVIRISEGHAMAFSCDDL